MAELKTIEEALEAHHRVLQTHAASNALHEQALRSHEHELAEFEQGGAGEPLIRLAGQHQKEADKHARMRDAHERIKRHHHALLAKWNVLIKALGEAS